MANFNLEDYETVEERIKRFLTDHNDGRIITENLTTPADRERSVWIVRASVFQDIGEQDLGCPKATGLAFEIDGVGLANKTSALENAETSAIGRALANAGYSGNKRASREEMAKVARGEQAAATTEWAPLIDGISNKAEARDLWARASKERAPKSVLAQIEGKAQSLES